MLVPPSLQFLLSRSSSCPLLLSSSVHDIVRAAGVAAPTQDPSQQSTERPIARAQPTLPPQPFAAAVARPPPSRPQPASAAPPTSTTPILPPSAPIRTTPIPPSSAPPMADFSPLIAALKSRPSQPPPLRSLVGELVLRINLKAFSMAGTTTCREYFDAARASGVVTMGNGAKAGAEWIGLVASNSSSDPQPSQPQSVVPSAQHKFQPLIDVLKSSPYPFPLRAKVAADLFQLKLVPSFFSRAGVDNCTFSSSVSFSFFLDEPQTDSCLLLQGRITSTSPSRKESST